MARSKKTAANTSTAPKTRGIDLQEVEARVTALDKAKRRSYDIFDIEQRVYNLEKNGSTPTPTETLVKFGRENNGALSGSYTFETDKTMNIWLDLEASKLANYSFKKNGESFDISTYQKSTLNVSNYGGYTYYENIPFTSGDVFSWTVTDNYRCFIAFG